MLLRSIFDFRDVGYKVIKARGGGGSNFIPFLYTLSFSVSYTCRPPPHFFFQTSTYKKEKCALDEDKVYQITNMWRLMFLCERLVFFKLLAPHINPIKAFFLIRVISMRTVLRFSEIIIIAKMNTRI